MIKVKSRVISHGSFFNPKQIFFFFPKIFFYFLAFFLKIVYLTKYWIMKRQRNNSIWKVKPFIIKLQELTFCDSCFYHCSSYYRKSNDLFPIVGFFFEMYRNFPANQFFLKNSQNQALKILYSFVLFI